MWGIINGMSDIDPENADKYRKNSAAYLAKLKALHAKTLAKINSLQPRPQLLRRTMWIPCR